MRLSLLACCLASLTVHAAVAVPPRPDLRLTIEAALAPDAFGRRPTQQAWSPDGRRLLYQWDENGGKALWLLDAATGRSEVLARLTDLGEDDKALDLDAFSWSPGGDALLLIVKGDLYLLPVDLTKPRVGKLRRLTRTESEESDARFSPDGRRIAFVRGLDLYVLDVATAKETRLTDDGRENTTLNGIDDWVYGEEIWGREPRAYWWSPDSAHIAYYHFDERSVGIYSLLNAAPLYPEIVLQKYPKAGTTNPQVKIGVANLATGHTTWMATGDPNAYLARLEWTPRGTPWRSSG
jgi:dipeptidyl-peptidase-4